MFVPNSVALDLLFIVQHPIYILEKGELVEGEI
jgi:hypothetical protein